MKPVSDTVPRPRRRLNSTRAMLSFCMLQLLACSSSSAAYAVSETSDPLKRTDLLSSTTEVNGSHLMRGNHSMNLHKLNCKHKLSSSKCLQANGEWAPCGRGNDQCGPPLQGLPRYHFTDRSCKMNDPNAPFYDAVHGVYHLFYQDHLWAPMPPSVPTGREGPVWGHAVSKDMIHWKHVPVGLWNGDYLYEVHGIFTGSATIVDGVPKLVFPGVCDVYPPGSATGGTLVRGCKYGYAFGSATPSNRSDPFLINWTKSSDAIANDTFDDPSSAWLTSTGEWRFIGHCGDGTVGDCGPTAPQFQSAPIWASKDHFKTWTKVGFTNLPAGECASLYPLPPLVNGTILPSSATTELTHVHYWGCGWLKNCYALGAWIDGKNTSTGSWTTASTSPTDGVLEDGIYYAAKDFWDSRHERRIVWAWAPLYTSSMALPREVRYDPRLEQLVLSPLAEQAQLRNATLSSSPAHTQVKRGTPLRLSASVQSEVELIIQLPHEATQIVANFSLKSRRDDLGAAAVSFVIEYPSPPKAMGAAVGRAQNSGKYYVARVHGFSSAKPSSGVSAGGLTGDGDWEFSSDLRLFPGEKELHVRLFFDHTIAEGYWQDRVAMTLPLATADWTEQDDVEIVVSSNTKTPLGVSAHVWSVASMWDE